VSWISGRTDLLVFLFGGLATLFFIRSVKKKSRPEWLASAAAVFLALLSKETAVMLPLIFLFFLYKSAPRSVDVLRSFWPYALALLVWFALRWNALGSVPAGASGRTGLDFLAAIGFYGWKMVFPFNLSLTVDSLPVIHSLVFRIFGAAILAGLGLSVRLGLRKSLPQGWPAWAFMSYALLLLPSGLVVLSSAAISLLAWRFLYLPSAVLIGALAWLLDRRLKSRTLAVGAVVLLSAFYAAEIYPKNSLFGKDETGFWLGIKNPGREDALARFNIGVKTLPVDENKALALFETILSRPDHPLYGMLKTRIYEELAIYYAFKRDFPRAESYFNELFRTQGTQSLHSYFNYAYYLGISGKREDGEDLVSKLLRQFPRNHNVLVRAAKFYLIVQDYRKAAELYAEDFRLFRTGQSRLLADEAARLAQKTQ
jgi:tetratricopeptide (TPR) repeat protein